MASISFTFVNATGAPKLSKVEAKKRRGHITRVNFASRRERKAEREGRKTVACRYNQNDAIRALDGPTLAIALSTATSRTDPYRSAQLLVEFWSLLFLDKDGCSGIRSNTEWLNIHASEPALIEATMVIAIRYWSPDALCTTRAELHSHRALGMLLQRIETEQAYTEGFLLAALVMALGERLMQNDAGWEVHMNGVIQAVQQRQSRNLQGIPSILASLLILDSTNNIFGYPRMFHDKLVDLAVEPDNKILPVLAAMSQDLSRIRKWVNARLPNRSSPGGAPPDLEHLWVKLYIQCQVLRGHNSPFVRATLLATQIILLLSSPPGADESCIIKVAHALQQELSQLPGRSCWCMELTSCQIIVGAIASPAGSKTRAWFMGKLKTGVSTMRARGWDDPFAILERVLAADEDMLRRLRALWKEETEIECAA
ncbi:hypothetical protein HJFPF1_07171 [Paramyrothecium foliicola]|nr:hypothetical protein HJFPF1_07171 [Paramyrothecium foliicola]